MTDKETIKQFLEAKYFPKNESDNTNRNMFGFENTPKWNSNNNCSSKSQNNNTTLKFTSYYENLFKLPHNDLHDHNKYEKGFLGEGTGAQGEE